MNNIMERVNKVFKIIFDNDEIILTEDTCADDIEGWDSLQHINLIYMLEKEFQIEFDIEQIVLMENVGDMVRLIESMV